MSKFTCPRRFEPEKSPNGEMKDHWRAESQSGLTSCAYCGSLDPEFFLKLVEEGCLVIPTDKTYKAYLEVPNPKAGELYVSSVAYCDPSEVRNLRPSMVRATAEEHSEILESSGWTLKEDMYIDIVPRPAVLNRKFYFQHLDSTQKDRFLELLNSGVMKVSLPGYFYILPYFLRVG